MYAQQRVYPDAGTSRPDRQEHSLVHLAVDACRPQSSADLPSIRWSQAIGAFTIAVALILSVAMQVSEDQTARAFELKHEGGTAPATVALSDSIPAGVWFAVRPHVREVSPQIAPLSLL